MTVDHRLELPALDGSNPLAFLAALGVLVSLAPEPALNLRLSWRRAARVTPTIHAASPLDAETLCGLLAHTPAAAPPLVAQHDVLDITCEEFRGCASDLIIKRLRTDLDVLAAFGADADGDSGRIARTQFCFTSGSGHQKFLENARVLTARADERKFREALFMPWSRTDQKYSMRWDPADDRRYAYLAADPSTLCKDGTVWMANLLAYRALTLFPCVPDSRSASKSHGASGPRDAQTVAWSSEDGRREPFFAWPIWEPPAALDAIRSLLQMADISDSAAAPELRRRGITGVFCSRRLRVGSGANFKLNFAPARALW
ncbi:MAG TPA: hypothetical protein VE996_00690 [Terriglobales bacterium]|nr:hypothetical protein [Terriglobales bacterium]